MTKRPNAAHRHRGTQARSCFKKHAYSSEIAVRMGAQATLVNKARGRDLLFVYACPACPNWHVTHDPRGKTSAVSRSDLHHPLSAQP